VAAPDAARAWENTQAKKSLEELAQHPQFEEMLRREFPNHASEWSDPVSRRRFLALMGASLALAGLNGCTRRPPGIVMPYVRQPARMAGEIDGHTLATRGIRQHG